jgi:predicted CoA-binding protein
MAEVHGELGDEQLSSIMRQARRIAVVGLSPRADRPSHRVAAYLQSQGYLIYPVNPTQKGQSILGCAVFGSLTELPEPPDIIDVFRRPQYVPDVVDDAIAARSRYAPNADMNRRGALWVIWTQLGVVHDEAARRAREAGFAVVEDRCLKVEHARLGIGPVAPRDSRLP